VRQREKFHVYNRFRMQDTQVGASNTKGQGTRKTTGVMRGHRR
jgi:hypothetical protein